MTPRSVGLDGLPSGLALKQTSEITNDSMGLATILADRQKTTMDLNKRYNKIGFTFSVYPESNYHIIVKNNGKDVFLMEEIKNGSNISYSLHDTYAITDGPGINTHTISIPQQNFARYLHQFNTPGKTLSDLSVSIQNGAKKGKESLEDIAKVASELSGIEKFRLAIMMINPPVGTMIVGPVHEFVNGASTLTANTKNKFVEKILPDVIIGINPNAPRPLSQAEKVTKDITKTNLSDLSREIDPMLAGVNVGKKIF